MDLRLLQADGINSNQTAHMICLHLVQMSYRISSHVEAPIDCQCFVKKSMLTTFWANSADHKLMTLSLFFPQNRI